MSGIGAAFFGTLGDDAERKTSNGGEQYLRCRVRVGDGDAAQWVSVLAFDEAVIPMAARLTKNARVYVEGTVRIGEWTGRDGAAKHGLSVIAGHIRLSQIGRNRTKDEGHDRPRMAAAQQQNDTRRSAPVGGPPSYDDEIPF
jgi:single-stranded DNA-binding protein